MEILPYERIKEKRLIKSLRLFAGEHLLVLQPWGWHLDGKHIPNAVEHFSRAGVCEDHHWRVVCDYGPYIAIVAEVARTEPTPEPQSPADIQRAHLQEFGK